MYEPGTILQLRELQSTDDKVYPYDRVKVVGQSPVQHVSSSGSAWAGADATGYIITPLEEFAPTLDKPYGQLEELYEIEAWPTDPVTGEPLTPEANPRNVPTPEQILRKAAAEQPAPEPRKPAPSVQHNAKSPEQVLREASGPTPAAKRKPGRPKKEEA